MRGRGRVVLGLAMVGALGTSASADTTRCDRINHVPTIISSPGVYCLGRHLSTGITSGAAISIKSDNVTLDLGGFTLAGTGGPGTEPDNEPIGIAGGSHNNITIRDGTVRGFEVGISLIGSHNLVERIRAVGNRQRGIQNAGGERNIVRQSQVFEGGPGSSAIGIGGTGSRALDNDVFGFPSVADVINGVGIAVAGNGVVVQGNRIGNPPGADPKDWPSFGIILDTSAYVHVLVIDNRITGVGVGIDANGSSVRCLGNVFAGVSTETVGCLP